MTCWICGNSATTGEHQQKKTDVTSLFGEGGYKDKKVIKYDFDTKTTVPIQGPTSKALKYAQSLCTKCNNERTQPFDKAYEVFAKYLRENFRKIKMKKEINTNLIYGKDKAKKMQNNLFLYFVKAFGCQLNDNNLSVPQELKDALLGKSYGNNFKVSICINDKPCNILQNFQLEGDQDSNGNPINYYWAQNTGWFTVVYACDRSIPHDLGVEWSGKSRKIYTGKLKASNKAFKPELGSAQLRLSFSL